MSKGWYTFLSKTPHLAVQLRVEHPGRLLPEAICLLFRRRLGLGRAVTDLLVCHEVLIEVLVEISLRSIDARVLAILFLTPFGEADVDTQDVILYTDILASLDSYNFEITGAEISV